MKSVEKLFVDPEMSILQVLEIIDRGSVQIALVVDRNRRLLGTVTDGDIRRGILRGVQLSCKVTEVMNSNPVTASTDMDRDMLLALMQNHYLRHIPVLDEEGRVVRIELLDELMEITSMDNWVVLMAGGLGTRLRELTKDTPKPLLQVGHKPILEMILESFISNGFHKFYISINYKAEMIRNYFGNGSKWGVEIRYLHERKPLGTAGALSLIEELPEKPIIVMNGDLLTKVNFRQFVQFHMETQSKATMCVREYEFQVPYGVVKIENLRLRGIEEKPIQRYFISSGIYILNPEVIRLIPEDTFFDMPTLFDKIIQQGLDAFVYPLREYWIDIGRKDDLERAKIDVYQEGFL